jgi:hypothetical protein
MLDEFLPSLGTSPRLNRALGIARSGAVTACWERQAPHHLDVPLDALLFAQPPGAM